MGILSFLTEGDWSRHGCYGNSTKGVNSFLLWCTVVVPSLKNTASIFLSFIQYFSLFSCKQYDVITDLICIKEKCQYRKQDISKRKAPFFCILKGLWNKHIFFSFHWHSKEAQSSSQHFLRRRFWWFIITIRYHVTIMVSKNCLLCDRACGTFRTIAFVSRTKITRSHELCECVQQCYISSCALLPLRFALILKNASGL